MQLRCGLFPIIVCFLCFTLVSFGWISTAMAGTLIEEFDNANLDERYWEMRTEGDASYEIADGQLTMTSPGVADGALLFWQGGDLTNGDLTVEIKATVAANTDNAAVLAFLTADLPPTVNTDINVAWLSIAWCGKNTPGWYVNNEIVQGTGTKLTDAAGPEFEGIWKAEIKGDKVHFYFNDEEVTVVDKREDTRYLCFGPDTYTSHYSGEMTIDWIKLSGPTIADIESAGKLPAAWGEIKLCR